MKRVSGKDLAKILSNRGWSHDRTKGSHHIFKHPDGRIVTVPVHGNKTLDTGTQRAIMKATGLTEADL